MTRAKAAAPPRITLLDTRSLPASAIPAIGLPPDCSSAMSDQPHTVAGGGATRRAARTGAGSHPPPLGGAPFLLKLESPGAALSVAKPPPRAGVASAPLATLRPTT